MTKLKIAAGDLRHSTTGRHSIQTPIGIGYISAYTIAELGVDAVDIRLFDDANEIVKAIDAWKPDVVALSNYCWNSELTAAILRYAKSRLPDAVRIAGGPDFPVEPDASHEYLANRPDIDFYVYREGEAAFANICLQLAQGALPGDIKKIAQGGIKHIDPDSGGLVTGDVLLRIMDMDKIPSPYLTGLFDPFFNGRYAPAMEMARGCPYSCSFCHESDAFYNKIARFSADRLIEELTFIAGKMSAYPNVYLHLYDTNFGMYKFYEEIVEHLRRLQDEFGWPNAIKNTTGKSNYDRILRLSERVRNSFHVTVSAQSWNDDTLDVIARKNLNREKYTSIQRKIKDQGMNSVAELIVPMPLETKQSYFDGLKFLQDVGVEYIIPYTTMLLHSTPLSSPEFREKYGMTAKFRILPRQFGEYEGAKVFEVEEVCVATSTMTFEEYLDCRGFGLVMAVFQHTQFDFLRRHWDEFRINGHEFFLRLWESIRTGQGGLGDLYTRFMDESRNELWDSKTQLAAHYSDAGNYAKLLTGESGDNLIGKYKIEALAEHFAASVELVYSTLKQIAGDGLDPDHAAALDAARDWFIDTRDLKPLVNNLSELGESQAKTYAADVLGWVENQTAPSIADFTGETRYTLTCDATKLKSIFEQGRELYGEDKSFALRKLLIDWDIKTFWRNVVARPHRGG